MAAGAQTSSGNDAESWWSLLDSQLSKPAALPRPARIDRIPRVQSVVLVGHRGAGKSTLLPHVASALGRTGIDLDAEIEKSVGGDLRSFFNADQQQFRRVERDRFQAIAPGAVIAVGGGFVSHHRDLLRHALVVVIPISEHTYRARCLADTTRPRLLPALSLDEEVSQIWEQREREFADPAFWSFERFVRAVKTGSRPLRVVTCPPHTDVVRFIASARDAHADAVELRTDLLDLAQLDANTTLLSETDQTPLIISERGRPIPARWAQHAWLIDRPLDAKEPGSLPSHHALGPLSPAAALEQWSKATTEHMFHVKHVEPLEDPRRFPQLLETRALLEERFGRGRVTVLVTGEDALPFRAVLAADNGLDYLAFSSTFAAAPGQRLLADAVREFYAPTLTARRRGIFGTDIGHSRSPRIHRQPFDRIDLPPDTDLVPLLEALHPHYDGFAVTSPFKSRAARAAESRGLSAINTIARTETGWRGANVDIDGARAVLEPYAKQPITVLGSGGVAEAIRTAAQALGCSLQFFKQAEVPLAPISGLAVWTWPATIAPPSQLRFSSDAQVLIISYGKNARTIEKLVIAHGGRPIRVGPTWFIAQARAQREHWA